MLPSTMDPHFELSPMSLFFGSSRGESVWVLRLFEVATIIVAQIPPAAAANQLY
jgi:hypothetical protein